VGSNPSLGLVENYLRANLIILAALFIVARVRLRTSKGITDLLSRHLILLTAIYLVKKGAYLKIIYK
jgi:hypothetical protein